MSAPSDTTSGSLAELYPFNLNISSTAMTELNLMLQAGSSATLWLGVQAGSALIFLLLLVLLTRPSKRGTSVFRLNTAALLLSFIRSTCQVSYFTSAFWTFEPTVNVFAADMDVNSIVVSQSLAALCAAAQASCVIGSLYLQIQAVCAPMSCQSKRLAVLIATAILAVVNVVYIWVVAILDISVCIVGWRDTNCVLLVGWWQIASWLFQGTVFLFSCVFVGKLGVAIAQRRRLGLRQFGPMHIVAICGTQTMVVPAIFAIAQPFSATFAVSATLAMTLVTLSLPFSAVWASEALPDEQEEHRHGSQPGSATAASFRARFFGSRDRLGSTPSVDVESQGSRGSAAGLWKGLWKKRASVVEVTERNSVGSV